MEFEVQRSLFAYFLQRLTGAVTKSNDPKDTGRYIVLKTTDGKLSATVSCDDVLANVSLDSGLFPNSDLLCIKGSGTYAVNGSQLIDLICESNVNGTVKIKFEDNAEMEPPEDEDEDSLPGVGALKIDMLGLSEKHETTWLQCVSLPAPSAFDVDEKSKISVNTEEFVKTIEKVGTAAGKSNQNIEYGHVLLRTVKGSLDLVTLDGHKVAWAKIGTDSSGKIKGLAPYDRSLAIAKTFVGEDLSIYKPSDGPEGIVFSQSLTYGEVPVGRSVYRTLAVSENFPNFEQIIKNLDFRFGCKFKTQHLQYLAKRLSLFETVKTKLIFDPVAKTITFEKDEAAARAKDYILPLIDAEGQKLEMYISSRFLKSGVAHCENEEMEIKFSGQKTLMVMNLAKNLKLFLQPFGRLD